jgi:hypothetical protein
MAAAQIVQYYRLISVLSKVLTHMRADIACTTDNQDIFHSSSPNGFTLKKFTYLSQSAIFQNILKITWVRKRKERCSRFDGIRVVSLSIEGVDGFDNICLLVFGQFRIYRKCKGALCGAFRYGEITLLIP